MSWTVALAFRRISMRRPHNRRLQLFGPYDDFVEVGHFTEPQQNAIADFGLSVDEKPMVVFDIAVMKLKGESAAGKQPLVLGTSMITAETQQLLIPAARRLDIAYRDHGLGLSCSNRYHNPESVASRVVDLHKPSLATIKLGLAMHFAAVGDDSLEGSRQVVG